MAQQLTSLVLCRTDPYGYGCLAHRVAARVESLRHDLSRVTRLPVTYSSVSDSTATETANIEALHNEVDGMGNREAVVLGRCVSHECVTIGYASMH